MTEVHIICYYIFSYLESNVPQNRRKGMSSTLAEEEASKHKIWFAVWAPVVIGLFKTTEVLFESLKKFEVNKNALNLLYQPGFTLAQKEEKVTLCRATVQSLTGKTISTTQEIFDAIKKVGHLCPAEVGPALRVQFLDQQREEWLRVAMEPIPVKPTVDVGDIFVVECKENGEMALDVLFAPPHYIWHGDDIFIFCE